MSRARVNCSGGALLFALCSSFLLAQATPKGVAAKPPDAQSFVRENKVAVLVGISDYDPDSGFPKLNYAAKDAQDLNDVLKRQGYHTHLLVDDHAKRLNVRAALKQAVAELGGGKDSDGERGTILFAFSGHGTQKTNDGGSSEQFLVTFDASADDIKPGIAMKEIIGLLTDSGASRKMMFIDACRDLSTVSRKGPYIPSFNELEQSEGLKILYSTAPGHPSFEDDKVHNGVFTHYLLDGLSGKGAKPDGLITFDSLASWVTLAMKSDQEGKQVPYINQGATGDFYIAGQLIKKQALVIGIDRYSDHPLHGAVNGAIGISQQLQNHGFTVYALKDATLPQIRAQLRDFAKTLGPKDVALVYFAGSGGIASGQPFLLTADGKLPETAGAPKWTSVPANAISLKELLDTVSRNHAGPNVYLLDMGLARASSADTIDLVSLKYKDTLVLFGCKPGTESVRDDNGSAFSRAFTAALSEPGMSAGYAASKIVTAVFMESNGAQYPIDIPMLDSRAYLTEAP